MKKIYLVRHGETESNRKGIFRGRLNIPLSLRGKNQAFDLKRYFEKIPVDVVYTSPLQRAIETAETAFPGIKPITETIAAVSHRSVVKVILAAVIGLERNYYWKFHLDNASVSQVYYEPERGLTVVNVNDTHHLQDTVMEWY